MDIRLSSDALDVAFAPAEDRNLLATGLISGKVQLIDYGELQKRRERGDLQVNTKSYEGSDEDGDEEEVRSLSAELLDSADEDEQGGSAYASSSSSSRERSVEGSKGATDAFANRLWTTRPSQKSCRGVAFSSDSRDLWTIAKDGSIFCLDVERGGEPKLAWKKAHAAAPSRLLPLDTNSISAHGQLLATGDDDGVVAIWDPRRPFKGQVVSEPPSDEGAMTAMSSSSAVRTYSHHYDWITDMLWCQNWIDPRTKKKSKEEEEEEKRKKEKKRRRKDRKRGQQMGGDEEEEAAAAAVAASRERLVVTR